MSFSNLLAFGISLFVLLNPLAVGTAFLTMTAKTPADAVKKIPFKFFIGILAIMFISFWAGELFLKLFGLTLPAFQLVGGIILITLGLNMILPKSTPAADTVTSDSDDPTSMAIVPLAIPLGAGPGVITLLIESSERNSHLVTRLAHSGVILIVCVLGWWIVALAPQISRHLGKSGVQTLSCISGLIIATIGMGMLGRAIYTLFPGLH